MKAVLWYDNNVLAEAKFNSGSVMSFIMTRARNLEAAKFGPVRVFDDSGTWVVDLKEFSGLFGGNPSMAVLSTDSINVNWKIEPPSVDHRPTVREMVVIPAGAIFTMSSGSYSDYSVHGVYKAIRDIDPRALLLAYLEAHPEEREKYHFNKGNFLATFLEIIEEVPAYGLYLGGDGGYREIESSAPDQKENVP